MPFPTAITRNSSEISAQELRAIGEEISRDFAPRLYCGRGGRRILMNPHQLLEIGRQISREYAPGKSVALPILTLLPVSPRRLHAYWHLAERRLGKALRPAADDGAIVLRIVAQPEPSALQAAPEAQPDWLELTLPAADGRQDIALPEAWLGERTVQYRAMLGEVRADGTFSPLLYSNAVTPPALDNGIPSDLPAAIAQFIMPVSNSASSTGKNASSQGKSTQP